MNRTAEDINSVFDLGRDRRGFDCCRDCRNENLGRSASALKSPLPTSGDANGDDDDRFGSFVLRLMLASNVRRFGHI